jgi:molecular chaperone GrpE
MSESDRQPDGPTERPPPLPESELDEPPESELEDAPEPELDELRRLARERDEYRDTLLRVQAEFENYRKRMLRQQSAAVERAAESVVSKLLPLLDAHELAAAHHPDIAGPLRAALWAVLQSEGVERIDPTGEVFDPSSAEAVEHEDGEGPELVAETLRPGYRFKGHVLRPALVKVRNGEVSAERS